MKKGAKNLTESEAKRIWFLHKKGLKPSDICTVVERAYQSVARVIDAFSRVERGEIEAVVKDYESHHKSIVDFAKSHFEIQEEDTAGASDSKKTAHQPDETIKYLFAVLTEQRRTNELLEKLLAAWER